MVTPTELERFAGTWREAVDAPPGGVIFGMFLREEVIEPVGHAQWVLPSRRFSARTFCAIESCSAPESSASMGKGGANLGISQISHSVESNAKCFSCPKLTAPVVRV